MPYKDVLAPTRAQVPGPRGISEPPADALRVALVHERFTDWAGSERVVEQLAALWPEARLHVAVSVPQSLPESLRHREIVTSRLQRPFERVGKYQYLLPAMPRAMAALELPWDAELVVVSHHAFANRVQARPGTPVLSYVHTPPRWMWEPSMLAAEQGPWLLRKGLSRWSRGQRAADRAAAQAVTRLVANSRHVQARIAKWWERESTVVHPPVDTTFYCADDTEREDFFLLAGRLVPHKQPEIAIAAAEAAGVRLVIAGEGWMQEELSHRLRPGTKVTFLGRVSDEKLRELYRRCAALVLPGEEDFGIVMAEAQSCGAPIIARCVGGALDIVEQGVTGRLYSAPATGASHVTALQAALKAFSRGGREQYDHAAIARAGGRFSRERFRREMLTIAHETRDSVPERPGRYNLSR